MKPQSLTGIFILTDECTVVGYTLDGSMSQSLTGICILTDGCVIRMVDLFDKCLNPLQGYAS